MNRLRLLQAVIHAEEESSPFTKAAGSLSSIYAEIGTVITWLGVIAIAVLAGTLIIDNDPQSAKTTKKRMLYVILGVAVYRLAPVIIDWANSLF